MEKCLKTKSWRIPNNDQKSKRNWRNLLKCLFVFIRTTYNNKTRKATDFELANNRKTVLVRRLAANSSDDVENNDWKRPPRSVHFSCVLCNFVAFVLSLLQEICFFFGSFLKFGFSVSFTYIFLLPFLKWIWLAGINECLNGSDKDGKTLNVHNVLLCDVIVAHELAVAILDACSLWGTLKNIQTTWGTHEKECG